MLEIIFLLVLPAIIYFTAHSGAREGASEALIAYEKQKRKELEEE